MRRPFTVERYIYYVPSLKRYFNRKQFEKFLFDYIIYNMLWDKEFFYGGCIDGVIKRVKYAPFRCARMILGKDNVRIIYCDIPNKQFEYKW